MATSNDQTEADPSAQDGRPASETVSALEVMDEGNGVGRSQKWLRAAAIATLFAVSLAGCATFGYYKMFSNFMAYDDEGCLLIQFKLFYEGKSLYDDVFTIYGPLSFLIKEQLYRALGLSVTHDVGRLVCLSSWVGSGILAGLAAWRITRSGFAAWLAALVLFRFLTALVGEPGHPQDQCVLLLLLAILGATTAGRPGITAAILGTIAGALLMTKINLGIFLIMATGAAMLLAPVRGYRTGPAVVLYAACMLGATFLLMRVHIHEPWCRDHAVNVAVSLVTIFVIAFSVKRPAFLSIRQAIICAFAIVLTVGATSFVIHRHGTSWSGLIDGSILQPLRFGTSFIYPAHSIAGTWWVSTTWLVVALIVVALKKAGLTQRFWVQIISGVGRIAVGSYVLVPMLSYTNPEGQNVLIAGPSVAWLLMLAFFDRELEPREGFARLLLAILSVTETLWAYPVAGGQAVYGSFLSVLTLVIIVHDGLVALQACEQARFSERLARVLAATPKVAAVLVILAFGIHHTYKSREEYNARVSADLPGMHRVHISETEARTLRRLTKLLKLNADAFGTIPGLYSFYLWTGMPPPTGQNLTNWMRGLNVPRQEEIIKVLQSHKRTCAIVYPEGAAFWLPGTSVSSFKKVSPLVRYIDDEFNMVLAEGPYLFLVNKNRMSFIGVDGEVVPLGGLRLKFPGHD